MAVNRGYLAGSTRGQVKRASVVDVVDRVLGKRADAAGGPGVVSADVLSDGEAANELRGDASRNRSLWNARREAYRNQGSLLVPNDLRSVPDLSQPMLTTYKQNAVPLAAAYPDIRFNPKAVPPKPEDYDQVFLRFARENPAYIQPMSHEQVKEKVDSEGGVKPWGDTTVGRWVGNAVGYPLQALDDKFGSLITWFTHAPKGTSLGDWRREYITTNLRNGWGGSLGHDIVNNAQLQANGAGHAIANLWRMGGRYLNPNTYGDSLDARGRRYSYENNMRNKHMEHHEEASRIIDNFHNEHLKSMGNGDGLDSLGGWNYGLNNAVGEFGGPAIATAGLGSLAGAGGNALTRASHAAGNAIRGPAAIAQASAPHVGTMQRLMHPVVTARQAWPYLRHPIQNGTYPYIWNGTRNFGGNFVEGVGDTLAAPLKWTGGAVNYAMNPVQTVRSGVTRGVPTVARGAWDTGKAVVGRPAATAWRAVRHPVATTRYLWNNPGRLVGKPFEYAVNVLESPASRALMSEPVWQAGAWRGAAMNAADGRYWDAAKEFGDLGLMRGLGTWYMPATYLLGNDNQVDDFNPAKIPYPYNGEYDGMYVQ